MNDEQLTITIDDVDLENFKRLDQVLTHKTNYSRSFIKKLFENGMIAIEEENIVLSLKKLPRVNSKIIINIPRPIPMHAKAEDIPLDILYEDDDLLFLNKPAGLVVHPAPGHPNGTLVNALLFHCKDLKGIGDKIRPGIVHRLDKGTSGIMVVAKTNEAFEGLVMLFSKHDIIRKYQALTLNKKIADKGKLDAAIGRSRRDRKKMALDHRGKNALTHYKLLQKTSYAQHLELTLHTGRTHQIRVHLSQILNCPILMDPIYGNPKKHLGHLPLKMQELLKNYEHPLLHATTLGLIHPITKKELYFEIDPPSPFIDCLEILKNSKGLE